MVENQYNVQRVDPIGLLVLLLTMLLILSRKRAYVYMGIAIVIAFLPGSQRIVIGSLDFPFIRIAVIVGFIRCVIYQEARIRAWAVPDTLVLVWVLWSSATQFLVYSRIDASITRFGFAIDAAGMYFLARFLVRSRQDVIDLLKMASIVAICSAPFFLIESQTGRNIFSQLGGVPEYSLVRNGRLRCQGPFSHPIMAGLFWAMWLPSVVSMAVALRRDRILWILGCTAILIIVYATASSTPVMAVILGVGTLLLYPGRKWLSVAVWCGLFAAAGLHLVMAKGVHHVLARINIVSGSTGWHRYYLMDEAINHFGEWFLIGTESTAHWGLGLSDVTNQFVLEATKGGLVGMVVFTAILILVMRANGSAAIHAQDRAVSLINWGFFAGLIAMTFSFIGVSLFGAAISGYFLFQGTAMSYAQLSTVPGRRKVRARGQVQRTGRDEAALRRRRIKDIGGARSARRPT